jgi:hypothetical protein
MKKKIPIALRKTLDKVAREHIDIIEAEFNRDSIIKFFDVDPESDYYFEVQKINISGNQHNTSYTIKYKPYTDITTAPRNVNVPLSNLENDFKRWISLVQESNSESPIFDDNFTQTYYEDLEPEFEILEKDANYRPFKKDQQKIIIYFLDQAEKIIAKDEKEENKDNAKETIKLIDLTRSKITQLSKKEVVKNIRKIIAKGFKMGLQIGEKLLIEFTTELTKKLLLG